MPLFREVGSRLKEKFDGAAKVIPGEFLSSVFPLFAFVVIPAFLWITQTPRIESRTKPKKKNQQTNN